MADLTSIWTKVFTTGTKTARERLKKAHAKNPEFAAWFKEHSKAQTAEAGRSASKAKKVKPSDTKKSAPVSDVRAINAARQAAYYASLKTRGGQQMRTGSGGHGLMAGVGQSSAKEIIGGIKAGVNPRVAEEVEQVVEGFDTDPKDIAAYLINRHGKGKVTMDHIEAYERRRDSHRPIEKHEVMKFVKKMSEEVEQIDELKDSTYRAYLAHPARQHPKVRDVIAAKNAQRAGDESQMDALAKTVQHRAHALRVLKQRYLKSQPPTVNPNPYGYGEGRYMGDSVEHNGPVIEEGRMKDIVTDREEAERLLGGPVKPKSAVIGGKGQPKNMRNLTSKLARNAIRRAMERELTYNPHYRTEEVVNEEPNKVQDAGEYDYEGDMAMSQLKSIMSNAKKLHDMLEPNTNLPEWVQSKITLAEDYVVTAANYMEGKMNEEVEQVDEAKKKLKPSYWRAEWRLGTQSEVDKNNKKIFDRLAKTDPEKAKAFHDNLMKLRKEEVEQVDEAKNKPYIRQFRSASGDGGWKAMNKHGKTQYFNNRAAAEKHAGEGFRELKEETEQLEEGKRENKFKKKEFIRGLGLKAMRAGKVDPARGHIPQRAGRELLRKEEANQINELLDTEAIKAAERARKIAAAKEFAKRVATRAAPAARILGKVAAPVVIGMAAYDAKKGWEADPNATTGQKALNALQAAASGATLGLVPGVAPKPTVKPRPAPAVVPVEPRPAPVVVPAPEVKPIWPAAPEAKPEAKPLPAPPKVGTAEVSPEISPTTGIDPKLAAALAASAALRSRIRTGVRTGVRTRTPPRIRTPDVDLAFPRRTPSEYSWAKFHYGTGQEIMRTDLSPFQVHTEGAETVSDASNLQEKTVGLGNLASTRKNKLARLRASRVTAPVSEDAGSANKYLSDKRNALREAILTKKNELLEGK